MEWLIVWLVLVICSGVVASNKGRSVFGWVAIAVLVAPITILILLALPSLKVQATPYRDRGDGYSCPSSRPLSPPSDTKECPRCAETIKKAAVVCRFCGAELSNSEPQKHEDTTKTCPHCYALSTADAGKCMRCGHEFHNHVGA
ncbi:hypothetical protein TSH7_01230 [Azospirillum sp. TSH7]|nr:hypothetical protein TSH7_01230 [Azospirillum sp. TSH7]PWC71412.1 hypothetical protein TSH20_03845 [Azospirillum sp. TSH20]